MQSNTKKNKSPGVDGLIPEFYKSASELLGKDLVDNLQEVGLVRIVTEHNLINLINTYLLQTYTL